MHPKLAETRLKALELLHPISPWHKIGDCTFLIDHVTGTKIEDCGHGAILYVWGNGALTQQRECIAHKRFLIKEVAQAAEQELLACVGEWNRTMRDYQGKIEQFFTLFS